MSTHQKYPLAEICRWFCILIFSDAGDLYVVSLRCPERRWRGRLLCYLVRQALWRGHAHIQASAFGTSETKAAAWDWCGKLMLNRWMGLCDGKSIKPTLSRKQRCMLRSSPSYTVQRCSANNHALPESYYIFNLISFKLISNRTISFALLTIVTISFVQCFFLLNALPESCYALLCSSPFFCRAVFYPALHQAPISVASCLTLLLIKHSCMGGFWSALYQDCRTCSIIFFICY